MKHREEVMQILEAFDLTRSYRDAGELAGCSPKTVEHWVARRDAGELTATTVQRPQLIDEFVGKLEEWMEASHGKVRADVCHEKLVAMGYTGSERTTRRAVASARKAFDAGHRRVHRPWMPEPGLWFQWDFGEGPTVAGVKGVLFCAWLSWSRFRVVLPIRDKTLPTVIGCIDATLRRLEVRDGQHDVVPLVLPPSDPCSFCEYLAGERPYTVLTRDEVTAMLVTYEQRGSGHVLVIPVRHRETILDLTPGEQAALMAGVVSASRAIIERSIPKA